MSPRRIAVRLLWPLLHLTYLASALVPRNRRLWAFGSFLGRRFADNPKWLFLHAVHEQPPRIRAVWISRDADLVHRLRGLGYRAHRSSSLRGIWTQLRAGVYVVEQNVWDVGFWFSRRARLLNVWHGIPLKRINHSIDDPAHPLNWAHRGSRMLRARTYWTHPWARLKFDTMIATNAYVQGLMAQAFEIPRSHVLITGLPRNDALTQSNAVADPIPAQLTAHVQRWRRSNQRVLFYLPTYRDSLQGTVHSLPLPWDRLNDLLARHQAHLLVKQHPADDATLPPAGQHDRIHEVAQGDDPYPLLALSHVLISDYSSVLFDYLLTDRPILFYAPDLERYLKDDRRMYAPYESVVCGPLARDPNALLAALDALLSNAGPADADRVRRLAVQRRYHDPLPGSSAARVLNALTEPAPEPAPSAVHTQPAPRRRKQG